jgi:hypothetical protein
VTNPLSLASGVLPEFGAVTVIEAVCAAGFDAAGIWVEPGEWSAADTRASRAALAATGLSLLDVEVIWIKADRGGSVNLDRLLSGVSA